MFTELTNEKRPKKRDPLLYSSPYGPPLDCSEVKDISSEVSGCAVSSETSDFRVYRVLGGENNSPAVADGSSHH